MPANDLHHHVNNNFLQGINALVDVDTSSMPVPSIGPLDRQLQASNAQASRQ